MKSAAAFHVYTIWSGTTPVYVGQTGNVARRLREHARGSYWYRNVTHISVVPCESRSEARRVEAHCIGKLRPLGNAHCNPRRTSVAEMVARYEWVESFQLLNGTRADRHRWLGSHPEATPAERKWIALRDRQDARRRVA